MSFGEGLHRERQLAKGLSFKQAVWRQAFRNSLIPIATGIGAIFSLLFTGTVLIERVFDLDGMGLLSYNSVLSRDLHRGPRHHHVLEQFSR